ncbi:MAG: glycosyltransferase [Candidatus Paceibacterota bacterium]
MIQTKQRHRHAHAQNIKKQPAVSVALGVFNGEAYIAEQIASILAQTRPVDELIISDNASSDASVSIVQDIISADQSGTTIVLVESDENVGYTKNFERAISHCSGDLIFLSDHDDVWDPAKVEEVESVFQKDPGVSMVYHDAEYTDPSLNLLGRTVFEQRPYLSREREPREMIRRPGVKGCCMAFTARVKDAAVPFVPGLGKDVWLVYIASALGRIVPLSRCLILYRRHEGTLSVDDVPGYDSKRVKQQAAGDRVRTCREEVRRLEVLLARYTALIEHNEDHERRDLLVSQRAYTGDRLRLFQRRTRFMEAFSVGLLLKLLVSLVSGEYHRHIPKGVRAFKGDLLAAFS